MIKEIRYLIFKNKSSVYTYSNQSFNKSKVLTYFIALRFYELHKSDIEGISDKAAQYS